MTLVVVGHMDRTLGVAAAASAASGEKVRFTSATEVGFLEVPVNGCGIHGTARIESVHPKASLPGDCFVLAAGPTETDSTFKAHCEEFAGQPLLLAPGGFAGALRATEKFQTWGLPLPLLSEAPGWLFGGALRDGEVDLYIRKRNVDIASLTDDMTDKSIQIFSRYFPDLQASDLVSTSMSNKNAMIHPPLAVANATRIERQEEFYYWDEGFTPAVERVMTAIDNERVQLAAALGCTSPTLLKSSLAEYAADGMRGETFYQAVKTFPSYRGRRGPTELDGRFLVDDVQFGVAAFEQLAQLVGSPHSALTAVRVLAELILGRQLKADPASVQALADYARTRGAQP